jgi:hypothetical protein
MGYFLPNGAHINTNFLKLIEELHAKVMANEPIVFEEEWDGIRCLHILWHPDDESMFERWQREGRWDKSAYGKSPEVEISHTPKKRRWWQRLFTR